MFLIGNLLGAVATILNYALWFYMWIVIARAVISWVSPDPVLAAGDVQGTVDQHVLDAMDELGIRRELRIDPDSIAGKRVVADDCNTGDQAAHNGVAG